jgi:hypothetical protein
MNAMLNDETPRFSVKDIWAIVSFVALGAVAYQSLHSRVAAVETAVESRELATLPRRMDRLEDILCATEEPARAAACARLGVMQ